ncbi:hypothetical protein I7I48_08253 [Histoplasma ohiense]|nr:hypothetical protein I7I48_08253 [Histoplasma ohiense (nom. inval.)]
MPSTNATPYYPEIFGGLGYVDTGDRERGISLDLSLRIISILVSMMMISLRDQKTQVMVSHEQNDKSVSLNMSFDIISLYTWQS